MSRRAVQAREDAHLDMYMAHEDAVIAEIARHFPGFSRAIWAVVFHLRENEGSIEPGECCEPDA